MIHCCIDLELEQPKTNHQTPDSLLDKEKIIQVGYVVYKLEPQFEIIHEVREYVNIGVPLSKFIKKLTNITDEEISNGTELCTIYDQLVADQTKYGFSRVIKQWGGGDMDALRAELPEDVKWEFGHSGCNVKHLYQIYAEATGKPVSGGLAKCLGRCGLSWAGRGKHDALTDAINTAMMHNYLYKCIKVNKDSII